MSEKSFGFLMGFLFGVGVMTTIDCLFTQSDMEIQAMAIEHDCGCYDSKTGKFEWIKQQPMVPVAAH